VSANGDTVLFFDAARRLVATAVVTAEGVVAFLPDGSFVASRDVERVARAFRADAMPLTGEEAAERMTPRRIVTALGAS
jgi:hypothetical protein